MFLKCVIDMEVRMDSWLEVFFSSPNVIPVKSLTMTCGVCVTTSFYCNFVCNLANGLCIGAILMHFKKYPASARNCVGCLMCRSNCTIAWIWRQEIILSIWIGIFTQHHLTLLILRAIQTPYIMSGIRTGIKNKHGVFNNLFKFEYCIQSQSPAASAPAVQELTTRAGDVAVPGELGNLDYFQSSSFPLVLSLGYSGMNASSTVRLDLTKSTHWKAVYLATGYLSNILYAEVTKKLVHTHKQNVHHQRWRNPRHSNIFFFNSNIDPTTSHPPLYSSLYSTSKLKTTLLRIVWKKEAVKREETFKKKML